MSQMSLKYHFQHIKNKTLKNVVFFTFHGTQNETIIFKNQTITIKEQRFRVLFWCLLFRTAASLSGPQWLQLEYVLGACFSGTLHVFRTVMSTIRVRFGCLLFRTAACLSGPQWLQLEYVLGACFSGPH